MVEAPPSTEIQIRPRSGLATRALILAPKSPGAVGGDFRGEVMVALLNAGRESFTVARGDRIAQAVIARVSRPEIAEADTLSETDRGPGGFGSTSVA